MTAPATVTSDLRRFVAYLSLFAVAGLALVLFQVWAFAYSQGGSTTVYIDKFGEAVPELVMFYVVWPVIALGLFYLIETVEATRP